MPQIEPTDPCPCDSGRLALQCCVIGGKAIAREVDTRPPGAPTGFAHPKCYAAPLSDCSREITGEHYCSRDVLEALALGKRTIIVSGHPWQREPAQRVGISALEANILCGRHNSALSGLDAQAGRLFRALRTTDEDLRAKRGGQRVWLFAGIDIERWLLKAVMGLASAGSARTLSGEALDWVPPEMWCRILFGRVAFPATWGLYVAGIGAKMDLDPRNVGISPLTTDGVISGCRVALAGIELVLATKDVPPRRGGALSDDHVHRPNGFRFREPGGGTTRYVTLSWTDGRVRGEVQLDWRPPEAD